MNNDCCEIKSSIDSADQSFVGTYDDRYQNGEHEAVWVDLLALRDRVHDEPVYSDAVAVARETMSRARTNIETLIVRLDNIGYQFETARDTPPEVVQKIIETNGQQPNSSKLNFRGFSTA